MENIKQAIRSVIKDFTHLDSICSVLVNAAGNDTINYDSVQAAAGPSTGEVLLELWEWRLLLPVRSSKCGEWDARIMWMQPGEVFEMPNISRVLITNAIQSGKWDTIWAIRQLFQKMGEPDWEKMPILVRELKDSCVHNVISGTRIGSACGHHGLREKTGALIAVLKGAGIISPKLMAMDRSRMESASPLYEFNPSIYGESG
ncbi:MAG TPA: hypothetical protein VJ943_03985 [Desulfotignum sp.]|nr:hypothetical protein [Desulfotignum sp.]